MATHNEKERLAVIEEQMKQNVVEHKELKVLIKGIDCKLDVVMDTKASKEDLKSKADKNDVTTIQKRQDILNVRLWALLIIFVTTLLGALGWALRQLFIIRGN